MEPNPIFLLELRQARRSGFLFLLFGASAVMSGFIYWTGYYGIEPSVYMSSPFIGIPTTYYVLGIVGIPFSLGRKLASQQLHESLILQTPLTPSRIILGKFLYGMVLSLCLYGPVLFLLILSSHATVYEHLVGCLVSFGLSLCFNAVMLGFMSGVKSLSKLAGMIFCGFLFGACGVIPFFVLCWWFWGAYGETYGDQIFIAGFILLGMLSSRISLVTGTIILGNAKGFERFMIFLAFLFGASCFLVLLLSSLLSDENDTAMLILALAAYCGSPLLAVYIATFGRNFVEA